MPAPDAAGDDAGQIVNRNRPEHVHAPIGKAAEQHRDQTGPDNCEEQVNHGLEYAAETPKLQVTGNGLAFFLLIDVFASDMRG